MKGELLYCLSIPQPMHDTPNSIHTQSRSPIYMFLVRETFCKNIGDLIICWNIIEMNIISLTAFLNKMMSDTSQWEVNHGDLPGRGW